MPDEADPKDNVDRLLEHLKDDSLAARLVRAHRAPQAGDPAASMKAQLTAKQLPARYRSPYPGR